MFSPVSTSAPALLIQNVHARRAPGPGAIDQRLVARLESAQFREQRPSPPAPDLAGAKSTCSAATTRLPAMNRSRRRLPAANATAIARPNAAGAAGNHRRFAVQAGRMRWRF